MDECIEREALIEKLRTMPIPKQAGRANTWLDNCAAGVNAAIWEVASFPAADVAPVVHGRWEMRPTGMATDTGPEYKAYCTICNEPNKQYRPPFCPHYGAKMDGGQCE